MNILFIHSAKSSLVKEAISTIGPDHKTYVLTFPRHAGTFADCSTEIYCKSEDYRIFGLGYLHFLNSVIRDRCIDRVVGLFGNQHGSGYENIRILVSLCSVKSKEIYNAALQPMRVRFSLSDVFIDLFFRYEKSVIPIVGFFLAILRKWARKDDLSIKKIMFVHNSLTIGGVERLMLAWGGYLNREYDIAVVTDTGGAMVSDFTRCELRTYIRRPNVDNEPCEMAFLFYLLRVIHRERPDVLIVYGMDTIVPATVAATLSRVPLVFKVVNGDVENVMNSRPVGLQLKVLCPVCDQCIAVSRSVKQSLLRLGIPENQIAVINGTTIDDSGETFNEINWESKVKCFVCVSRLSPEKGIDVLLKAVARIKQEERAASVFKIVGSGSEKISLVELANNLGIERYIEFYDYQREIDKFYEEAYVTVLTSHTEGLPLVIIESMFRGRMCIASDVGGVSEVISHGNNGLLFHDNDIDQLARHLSYCIRHKEDVRRMAGAARATVRERYTINTAICELKNLFYKCNSAEG